MKATHTNYKHPRHLRVVTGKPYQEGSYAGSREEGEVLCVSPSASCYARLNKANLPDWNAL